jgi:tetrahydrodipicolinate N-succinyltransferase
MPTHPAVLAHTVVDRLWSVGLNERTQQRTAAFTAWLTRIEQRWSKPLSVAHVAEGDQRIVDAARARLGLLVASSRQADRQVIGLVTIGLAADEQLDIPSNSDDDAGLPRR